MSYVSCRPHVHVFNEIALFSFDPSFLDAKFATPGKGKEKASDVEQGKLLDNADEFLSTLANPALWSSLYHGRSPPFVDAESFGFEQPVVRRSAWSLLQTLLQTCQGTYHNRGIYTFH